MKIEVEIKKFVFSEKYGDSDNLITSIRVFVDGRRERGLEQVVRKEDFRSHFEIIWDEIGRKLKAAYKIKEPKDGS